MSSMQFFQIKFALNPVIKIYTKLRKLLVHWDYDHFYIPLTSKYGKFKP